MSHVELRRSLSLHQQSEHRRSTQELDPDDEQEEKRQSLTDELNEPDMKINELLISEFKLLNVEMRHEIRSLYRLLVIFVLIVIAMAIGGIIFCSDFFKNINDFHHAVFDPDSLQNPSWLTWYRSAANTLTNMQQTADFLSNEYNKWSPIVRHSFQNPASSNDQEAIITTQFPNNQDPAYLDILKNASSTTPIKTESEVLAELSLCDQCVPQLNPDGEATRNLWTTLTLIQQKSASNVTFNVRQLFGTEFFELPIWNMLTTGAKEIGRELWSGVKGMCGFGSRVDGNTVTQTDVRFTTLIRNIIDVISTRTKCETAHEIKRYIDTATAFMMDLPLGAIMEEKHINQIIAAESIIKFPYKHLMCGDTESIIEFYQHYVLRLMSPLNEYRVHFILLDLDEHHNGTMTVSRTAFQPEDLVIFGVSQRQGILQNTTFDTTLPSNVARYRSLGLMAIPAVSMYMNFVKELQFQWMDPAVNEVVQRKLVFSAQPATNQNFIVSHKIFDSSNQQLLMYELQKLSVEQYSQELMYRISHDLGGLVLKFLQVLSIREDVITSDILRKAFKEATDNNPARSKEEVHEVLKEEFGEQRYTEFTRQYEIGKAIKAGSVGQLHEAKSKIAGQPDRIIKITFHKQVHQKWKDQWELLSMFGNSTVIATLHNCWDTVSSIDDKLFAELNFNEESKYTQLAFQALGHGDTDSMKQSESAVQQAMVDIGFDLNDSYLPCRVMRVIKEWSTSHVLMQEHAEGKNLKDWLKKDRPSFAQKSQVFKSLIVWWSYLAFEKHIVHSDPHYGNVMVALDENKNPVHITLIDFGQTDLFIRTPEDMASVQSKYDWFMTFKKLMKKMNAVYSSDELRFGQNVDRLIETLKAKLIEEDGLYKLFETVFLESIDPKSMFKKLFLEDLAGVMQELGFESEKNTPMLLAGIAMGALNNDPRYCGAKKTQQWIEADPLKSFPSNAALIFRSVTGIVGMLNDQESIEKQSLTNGLPLVPMFVPFL